MYEVVFVTVLVTISVLVGLSFVLPDTALPESPESPETTPSKPEDRDETKIDPVKTTDKPPQSFSSSCYDAIAVREQGRVYIFQSKKPLQDGVNPVIFPDLPSYRVWAERSLGDGIKCPVLYYNPDSPPYVHSEEKYSGVDTGKEVSMVRASKHDTLMETRDMKSSYVRSAVMEPARYVAADGVEDDVAAPAPPYAEARGRVRNDLHDNLITRSQREAAGVGADTSLPTPARNNLRDVSRDEIALLAAEMEEKNPSMRGAVLKRTGYSQYEVAEIIPERLEDDNTRRHITDMGTSNGLDMDLLAYGGTVVPVSNINKIFG